MYELYAVVNHFGDLRNGHYTVTIKDEMGTYNFNDSTVNKVRKILLTTVCSKTTTGSVSEASVSAS